MTLNNQGRPTASGAAETAELPTISGDRGLFHEEPLIFEHGRDGMTGVDLPDVQMSDARLGGQRRKGAGRPAGSLRAGGCAALCALVADELFHRCRALSARLLHYEAQPAAQREDGAGCRASAICTHWRPQQATQGALELISELMKWLTTLTGDAGGRYVAQGGARMGELCGLLAIPRGDRSAGRDAQAYPGAGVGAWDQPRHAAFAGFTIDEVKGTADGRVDMEALEGKLGPDVAAIMLTNPNTCGLFERDIRHMADATHKAGAYFYCDGANFNAIAGRVRPGDLGIDAMHINLHKTFSTPHGGGGPGAGPVVLSERLAAFAPLPLLVHDANGFRLIEDRAELPAGAKPFGRMCAFHGQMGMFVRALSYMLSHGRDGVRQSSEDAVLSANYILASLKDVMSAPFGDGPCMHEALFDDHFLEGTGVTTLDFAKAMIDEGYHPMTMYFPLVVHGAMLIEPTESESKESLDGFIHVLRSLALGGEGQAGPRALRARRAWRRAAGLTRRPRRASRCCAGRRRICRRRQNDPASISGALGQQIRPHPVHPRAGLLEASWVLPEASRSG